MADSNRQLVLPAFADSAPSGSTPHVAEPNASTASSSASTEPVKSAEENDPVLHPVQNPTGERPAEGTPSLAGQTVFVLDAHSLIYQVFHALPEMTSPTGQPVGAVHGFIRDVLDILENQRPNYLFCAFDYPSEITFRHELYDQYKAHREAMPDDLRPQIPNIQRLLAALHIPVLQIEGYEADDILATIARQTEERGGTCYLVTSDKDCRQLISDRIKLFNLRKPTDRERVFDAASLLADWGIRPEQVIDYQALVGDSVDNVPGVPLIGPKLARELLEKYGTLEAVLDHAQEVSGQKRRENLIKYRDQALLSRRLVRLDDQVPIEIDWEAGRVGGIDVEAALALCREFGFRRLSEQIAQLSVVDAPARWQTDYRTVAGADAIRELNERLAEQNRIALHVDLDAPHPRWARVRGLALVWQDGEACYVPVEEMQAGGGTQGGGPGGALDVLRPVLEDPHHEKVGHDVKQSLIALQAAGVTLRGVTFDTMVADYLLASGERGHLLSDLAARYLNRSLTPADGAKGKKPDGPAGGKVAGKTQAVSAAETADVAWRLARVLETRLADAGLQSLFRELELPLIGVLAAMEFAGIKVDVQRLQDLSRRYGERLERLQSEIFEIAGETFNIDSPKQLSRILFEKLSLPVQRKTKTGPSTDAEVLGQLAKLHPLPAKIVEYRQNAKLKSTYVDALPQMVHPQTGRIHTSFKQDVAATGRLSSMEPNLQNIPNRTEEGREIRSAFLPGEEGWKLLTADYSQIELRVLAHFSGDVALRQAFAEDRDVHTQVASEVFGVPLAEVTREMRRRAKAVNFGVIYGQSPFGLAKALDIEQEEAAAFIDAYFARYPGVAEFTKKVLEECRQNGYVNTILGRRREVQGVRDPSRFGSSRQRTLPERIAINTVIQGSAADLIKQAMINVFGRLQRDRLRARMLLQIHDELVFEVPSDELTALTLCATAEMTAAGRLSVPLKVDVKVGGNWAECEPVD